MSSPEKTTDVRERLVRVETKLDYVNAQLNDFSVKLDGLLRIHQQERGRSQLMKAMIPLGSAMMGAGAMLAARLAHWIK